MGALLMVTVWALGVTVVAVWILVERMFAAQDDEYELVRQWDAMQRELAHHGDGKGVVDG